MSGTKPANLSTTSKDFPQELLDQLNYVVSDIYSWISELRGLDGFKHDEDSSTSYITADGVTVVNLAANGGIGTQSDQVASGDKGVAGGSNHDHVGGDGAAITEAAVTLADNTTLDVSSSKHGLVPRAPTVAPTTKFLRGDVSFEVPAHGDISGLSSTWTNVTSFENSWENLGGSYGVAAFCKDSHLFVHLRGLIKSGTVSSSAFTLPAGSRPSSTKVFAVMSNGALGSVFILTDGTVVPEAPSNNAYVSLDGISFYAG